MHCLLLAETYDCMLHAVTILAVSVVAGELCLHQRNGYADGNTRDTTSTKIGICMIRHHYKSNRQTCSAVSPQARSNATCLVSTARSCLFQICLKVAFVFTFKRFQSFKTYSCAPPVCSACLVNLCLQKH